jgi:hypothetical protein
MKKLTRINLENPREGLVLAATGAGVAVQSK